METRITISNSAGVVASIDDLLMEILLRLPSKSLMLFKLVSKHWKSLITSRLFSRLRNQSPVPIGLFYPGVKRYQIEFVPFDVRNPTYTSFKQLRFPDDPCAYWIHQSCHGLFLCCSSESSAFYFRKSPIRRSYVYNLTTGCFKKLPRPGIVNEVPRIVHGLNLAFDRAKSSPYKVVCVRGSEFGIDLCQIEVYSPDYISWRVSGKPFYSTANFDYGVHWNGSIHWLSNLPDGNELLYFNVDEETMGTMPLARGKIIYFGESSDHLHIIQTPRTEIAFDVCEIKKDYSGWFVKYRVDLSLVVTAFPDMVRTNVMALEERIFYAFSVFSVIRSDEEGSFLVLQVSHKLIKFNLGCNTFEEMGDFGGREVGHPFLWPVELPCAFSYFDSFACV